MEYDAKKEEGKAFFHYFRVWFVLAGIALAVTVGSLSGDLSQLVVLQVDHIETIVINGGRLGGLINTVIMTIMACANTGFGAIL